jgi:hypothetical protein
VYDVDVSFAILQQSVKPACTRERLESQPPDLVVDRALQARRCFLLSHRLQVETLTLRYQVGSLHNDHSETEIFIAPRVLLKLN